MKQLITAIFFLLTINFYGQKNIYQSLLVSYVDPASGYVYYKNLKSEKEKLNAYLDDLSKNSPEASWSKDKKKAYWLNVYNGNIFKLVIDNYEEQGAFEKSNIFSLKKDGKSIWKQPFIKIAGEAYSLDHVEHQIIRKEFKDARVHAAFNSACQSGPKVANFVFTEENVDSRLTQLMDRFINDSKKNSITANKIVLSKIFEWYKGDFEAEGINLIEFVNMYSTVKVNPNAEVSFSEFNWVLNKK